MRANSAAQSGSWASTRPHSTVASSQPDNCMGVTARLKVGRATAPDLGLGQTAPQHGLEFTGRTGTVVKQRLVEVDGAEARQVQASAHDAAEDVEVASQAELGIGSVDRADE